jgi:hypothetical protein
VWPQYAYATVAEQARVTDIGVLKVVDFKWNGFDFKLTIDPETGRIVQYALTDGTRTVEGKYSAFDAVTAIEAPK